MQKHWLIILLVLLISAARLMSISPGGYIPDFQVESGDQKVMKSIDLKDDIVFFFYDHKDVFQRNNDFKNALFHKYQKLPANERDMIEILQIIDCSEANFLNTFFYRKALMKNSEKYGFRIWGDWDGDVKETFGFEYGNSYLLIIDTYGKVSYYDENLFAMDSITDITDLLDKIFHDINCR